MQEEVTQRTVALCVETTRLSAGMPMSSRRPSGSFPQKTWRKRKSPPSARSWSRRNMAEKIAGLGTDAWYFPSFSEIEEFLLEKCGSGDLLITMGAGDIVKVGENLLKK